MVEWLTIISGKIRLKYKEKPRVEPITSIVLLEQRRAIL